ncbi:MAG: peptide chain release factor N(5)-glutamine methyltransferase [Proteobacteria bacterium]|nr:MAG: peptide chain release factor N(5)-glutamine methyltransferase [Pseudomonadota bacterium]
MSHQTISDALHTATVMLSRVTATPRLDAELLLGYVTGLSRAAFHAHPERALPAQAGWAFQQLVKRRMKGEPIAYIRGEQEFWSLSLEVTPAVLIPRPETELVVERALEHTDKASPVAIADIGTGSGAIALAIASERPHARILATDASRAALEIAQRNVARLQLSNVSLRRGSWLAPLGEERFHLIVSNPPYIAADDPALDLEVRRHEPHEALIAGPRGLEALEIIIADASRHLHPGGWLILEHGWKQGAAVRARLEAQGFAHVRSHLDLAGHERVTEGALLPGRALP